MSHVSVPKTTRNRCFLMVVTHRLKNVVSEEQKESSQRSNRPELARGLKSFPQASQEGILALISRKKTRLTQVELEFRPRVFIKVLKVLEIVSYSNTWKFPLYSSVLNNNNKKSGQNKWIQQPITKFRYQKTQLEGKNIHQVSTFEGQLLTAVLSSVPLL